MDRLFRFNSSTSSRLSTSSRSPLNENQISDIINKEHYSFPSNEQIIYQNWNIPQVPHNEIYHQKNLVFILI